MSSKKDFIEKGRQPAQIKFKDILDILPQKPPFIMIDSVIRLETRKIVAAKRATLGELSHFSRFGLFKTKIFPKPLISEAIGQAGIILFKNSICQLKGNLRILLTSIEATYNSNVEDGQEIIIEVTPIKIVNSACVLNAVAKVGREVVAQGKMSLFAISDNK